MASSRPPKEPALVEKIPCRKRSARPPERRSQSADVSSGTSRRRWSPGGKPRKRYGRARRSQAAAISRAARPISGSMIGYTSTDRIFLPMAVISERSAGSIPVVAGGATSRGTVKRRTSPAPRVAPGPPAGGSGKCQVRTPCSSASSSTCPRPGPSAGTSSASPARPSSARTSSPKAPATSWASISTVCAGTMSARASASAS